jgi:CubicO group peptidase (beta-lactamase class C family)
MSVAVVKDDKVVFARGFGLRDAAKRLPATPQTIYAIGSSTKAFTGLLVAQLAQEGKLSLTDRPSKWVPQFKLADPAADKAITVSDLLSHRSGMPRTDLAWYSGKFNREEVLELLSQGQSTAPLGRTWQYQNVMFMAAGMVAEKAGGADYHALIRDRFLVPLGMNRTGSTARAFAESKEAAVGYAPAGPETASRPVPFRNIDVAAPAGSIVSNVLDMTRWLRLQMSEGAVDGTRIVAKEALDEARKPRIEMIPGSGRRYGLGWMLSEWRGTPRVEHGGNIDGFNAEVAYLPEKKLGVVVLTNVSSGPLARAALDLVFGEFVPEPKGAAASQAFVEAEPEFMGSYLLELNKSVLKFSREGKRTILEQSGQRIPLKLIADRTYALDLAGAPEVRMEFTKDEKDAKRNVLKVRQSGMNFVLGPVPPYAPPIAATELVQKMVAALGGEEAIRRSFSAEMRYRGRMLADALDVVGVRYSADGVRAADFALFYGLNRRMGTVHSFSTPEVSANNVSFAEPEIRRGSERAVAQISAATIALLQPERYFKSIVIRGEEKVQGKDCYVVEWHARNGAPPIVDSVCKQTFLVLRRVTPGQVSETTEFQEYKAIDGIQVPVKWKSQSAATGSVQFELVSYRTGIAPPSWAFRVPMSLRK